MYKIIRRRRNKSYFKCGCQFYKPVQSVMLVLSPKQTDMNMMSFRTFCLFEKSMKMYFDEEFNQENKFKSIQIV